MSTAISTDFRWHCATSDQQIPCPRCCYGTTRWLHATPDYDSWVCSCGLEFRILVDEISPTTAYLVGDAVFTDRRMAEQYADRSESIEEIDLYNDIY